ncbi:MAG: hypothetical protein ABL959_17995 [Pyrinomonadaceae bacterium]
MRFCIRLGVLALTFVIGSLAALQFPADAVIEAVPLATDEVYSCGVVAEGAVESYDVAERTSEPNFDAWYTLDDIPKMPEVMLISVSRVADEEGRTIAGESSGAVFTTLESYGNEGVFSSSELIVDLNHVRFRTERRKGISYKFEGTFVYDRPTGEQGEELLLGTLEKFKNGKRVAVVNGNFAYAEPHCWH